MKPARGFVLLSVLVVVILASMVAVSVLFRMRAEQPAWAAAASGDQAWAAVRTGVREAMDVAATSIREGGEKWRDAPERLKNRLLLDDGGERWYFSVYSASEQDSLEARFGLTDEAGRVHLGKATEEMLLALPEMNQAMVDALLDYLDDDDFAGPEGAEQDYYASLAVPYAIRNGAMTTVEELLLVRGFSPAAVFGEDANQNWRLDAEERDGEANFPPDNQDDQLDQGLKSLVTLYSYEPNVDREGRARLNLNQGGGDWDGLGLPEETMRFIEAMRRSGQRMGHPAELVDRREQLRDENEQEQEMHSAVDGEVLRILLDRTTGQDEEILEGLINLNTAPAAVLATLPEIDGALAESIVSARLALSEEDKQTVAWIYERGVVTGEQFRKVAPFLTTRGYQFRFRAVGFGIESGQFRVAEVVVDLGPEQAGKGAVLYWRDLSKFGFPYALDRAELESGDSGVF